MRRAGGKPRATASSRRAGCSASRRTQAVYVGDQVITDVLGSQRAGLRAVLVKPKYTKEFLSAKFQRLVARLVIRLAGARKEANV